MSNKTKEQLKAAAAVIKNETVDGANTATRVGTMLEDIIDSTAANNLATVATSGSYSDLSNKPTIPDVSGLESTSNKTTSISSNSTDTQYPSAKAVNDMVHTYYDAAEAYIDGHIVESTDEDTIPSNADNGHWPTSLAVKTYVDNSASSKEATSNKVTSLNSSSTDTQYPSAKAVVDYVAAHSGGSGSGSGDTSDCVHLTGTETITGDKTFSAGVTFSRKTLSDGKSVPDIEFNGGVRFGDAPDAPGADPKVTFDGAVEFKYASGSYASFSSDSWYEESGGNPRNWSNNKNIPTLNVVHERIERTKKIFAWSTITSTGTNLKSGHFYAINVESGNSVLNVDKTKTVKKDDHANVYYGQTITVIAKIAAGASLKINMRDNGGEVCSISGGTDGVCKRIQLYSVIESEWCYEIADLNVVAAN